MSKQTQKTQITFSQLAATKADLYAVGLEREVKKIILHNTNSSAEQVVLLMHNGTNEYQIFDRSIAVDETYEWDLGKEGLYSPSASKITGSTTTGSKVTIIIDGDVLSQ